MYKAKVLKLRKDICEYLADHADNEDWTRNCDKRTQRWCKVVHVANYGKYCEEMAKDGTYMGDLKIQALSNMRNIKFQVATDKILHDDNAVVC